MEGNVEKRVKRHILSKTYRFLGVVQPAFREIAKREMKEEGFSVVGEVDGGVEFEGSLEEGWRANLVLRTISRVYCRIDSFHAGAREELYRKAKGIPWELWIPLDIPLKVESSAHASRIHHEGVMRETLLEAIHDRFREAGCVDSTSSEKMQEPVSPFRQPGSREISRGTFKDQPEVDRGGEIPVQRLLLHSEGNRCTVSLDMSGEGLYRRGYRLRTVEAPIREDIASTLLFEWGWMGQGILCDPMTGSGTFAIEGIRMGLGIPPGWNRTFQFQTWPSFREPRWTFVKKQAVSRYPMRIQAIEGRFSDCTRKRNLFCFASDWNPEAVEAARANSRCASVEEYALFEQKDFFSLTGDYVESRILSVSKDVKKTSERFLVLNPPYGKRLEADKEYPLHLWEHIRKCFPQWKVLLLLPASIDTTSLSCTDTTGKRIIFRHGGLRIQALFL